MKICETTKIRKIGIINPLRLSFAPLCRNIRKISPKVLGVEAVLSFPQMLHLRPGTQNSSRNFIFGINAPRRSETFISLASYAEASSFYGAGEKAGKLLLRKDGIFKTYAMLGQLTEALWSIYRSNNLRLSHSLLSLIRVINEKNSAEFSPYISGLPNVVHIQKNLINVLKKIDFSLFRQLPEARSAYGVRKSLNIAENKIFRDIYSENRNYYKGVNDISHIIANTYAMTPLLWKIYEGIEAGVYLYNADSYKSSRTLHRLTNSLWKVYLGQNLELSRSFSRLILRVNNENKSTGSGIAENNIFSGARSLKNLVHALKSAFYGSNLELRSSMVSLFGDIHNAGERKKITVNNYHKKTRSSLTLLHCEIVPEKSRPKLNYRKPFRNYRSEAEDVKRDLSRFEREIGERINRLETSPSSAAPMDISEEAIRNILERAEKKQKLDWRLEKLQRGIF